MACTGGGLLQHHLPRAPPTHCMISQSSLIAPATTTSLRSLAPLRSSLIHNQSIRLQTLTARGAVRRRNLSVQCSAAGVGGGAGDSAESPYQTLGVSPLEKFDNIKNVYSRRKKDAESRGDAAAVENLDRAYDRIMMMQLSNRKQGLAFGGQFEVSKEIKYADKRSWIPWGPKSAPSERKEVLINLAISGFFSAWMVASGQAEWKPLQFLIFGYMFRIFNKLKEFEPAGSTYVPTEDEEEGGGAERESSRRLKSGKRLLRTLGAYNSARFSCCKVHFTLYSSAKYPQIPPEQADFVPLFGGKETKLPIATVSLGAGQHQDGEEGTLELFRFFSETSHEYWPRENQRMDDIGSMPKNIKSVVDAMVFNSSELPYHQYRVVDNLAGADASVGEEEPKNKPAPLAAPPQSVLARDGLTSLGVEEYGFRPTLGEVPSFRLPSTSVELALDVID